ncbi:hypothetical protein MY8738_000751 [Beauveria namnaoensis]
MTLLLGDALRQDFTSTTPYFNYLLITLESRQTRLKTLAMSCESEALLGPAFS